MFIGEILALCSALTVGVGAIISKFLTSRVQFLVIQAFRGLVGGLFLALVCLLLGKGGEYLSIPPRLLLMILGASVFGIAIGDAIYMKILSLAPVSKAFPVITGTRVLFTALAGAIFFQEKASLPLALAAIFIIFGVYLALSSREPSSSGTSNKIKVWLPLTLVVGFLWTIYYVFMKFALAGVDPMIAGSLCATVASIILCIVLVTTGGRKTVHLKQYGRNNLLLIAANGILIYAISMVFELYALDIAGVGPTAILVSWTPVFVLILSTIFLKEKVTLRLILGTLSCIAGTILLVVM